MEGPRPGRVRHPRIRGLVQPPAASRTHRRHPTSRKGGQLPSTTGTSPASWTQVKRSPANPVRFRSGDLGILGVAADRGERGCQPGLKQRHVCIKIRYPSTPRGVPRYLPRLVTHMAKPRQARLLAGSGWLYGRAFPRPQGPASRLLSSRERITRPPRTVAPKPGGTTILRRGPGYAVLKTRMHGSAGCGIQPRGGLFRVSAKPKVRDRRTVGRTVWGPQNG